MPEKFNHTVLIVDDDEQVGKALSRLIKGIGARHVYLPSAREALIWMKKAAKPFSLILSDQRMPGMTGSDFLQKAKEISPDTIRFLITGYADAEAVTEAVNKGSIHRYISKPWDNGVLTETIRSGLDQYELVMENQRLFNLAKEQNTKLFNLNLDLKKRAVEQQNAILKEEKQIEALKVRLEKGLESRNYPDEIKALLKQNRLMGADELQSVYTTLADLVFEQFQDIAVRNGFEMPETVPGESTGELR